MRDKSTIRFEIPVPWSERPALIEASGHRAVVVAAIAGVLIAAMLMI